MMADDPSPIAAGQPVPGHGTGVQADLFSPGGGQTEAEKKDGTGSRNEPDGPAAPARTDAPDAAARKPFVFSDQNPRPHREGEKISFEPKKKQETCRHRDPVHLDPASFRPECTFGDLLKAAREKTGLSIEQTASITKLRAYYLIALEHADLEKLPPPVYVTAYVRTLCSLYALDAESIAFVNEKLQNIPAGKDVPLSLISELESNGQSNEAENRRIRRLFVIGTAFLLLLVLCAAGIIVSFVFFRDSASEQSVFSDDPAAQMPSGGPVFTDAEFDGLTVPQQMPASSLKMSRKPALSE